MYVAKVFQRKACSGANIKRPLSFDIIIYLTLFRVKLSFVVSLLSCNALFFDCVKFFDFMQSSYSITTQTNESVHPNPFGEF